MKIFSLCSGVKVSKEVLEKDFVYGISLRPGWRDMEPSANVYDWLKIYPPIKAALAKEKKIFLRVIVGPSSPQYILDDPEIPKVRFYSEKVGGMVTTPVPWSKKYLERYDIFCGRLATYLNNVPGVEMVAISGAADGAANPFLENEGMPVYVKAGYNGLLWTTVWKKMIDKHLEHFPQKTVSLCFDCKDNQVSEDLVSYAAKKYRNGKKITVQSNGLHGRLSFPSNLKLRFLHEYVGKVPIGFQMTWSSGERLGPMDQAIKNGVKFGAEYLEIYQEDILNSAYDALFTDTAKRR